MKILPEVYVWTMKSLWNFESHPSLDQNFCEVQVFVNFLAEREMPSTSVLSSPSFAISHIVTRNFYLWEIFQVCLLANSRKNCWLLLVKVLLHMYLWTRKPPLDFGVNQDHITPGFRVRVRVTAALAEFCTVRVLLFKIYNFYCILLLWLTFWTG